MAAAGPETASILACWSGASTPCQLWETCDHRLSDPLHATSTKNEPSGTSKSSGQPTRVPGVPGTCRRISPSGKPNAPANARAVRATQLTWIPSAGPSSSAVFSAVLRETIPFWVNDHIATAALPLTTTCWYCPPSSCRDAAQVFGWSRCQKQIAVPAPGSVHYRERDRVGLICPWSWIWYTAINGMFLQASSAWKPACRIALNSVTRRSSSSTRP